MTQHFDNDTWYDDTPPIADDTVPTDDNFTSDAAADFGSDSDLSDATDGSAPDQLARGDYGFDETCDYTDPGDFADGPGGGGGGSDPCAIYGSGFSSTGGGYGCDRWFC